MFQTSGEDVTALGLNERLCHSDPCQHFLMDWLPETQQQLDYFFFLFLFLFFLFYLFFLFFFFTFSFFPPFFFPKTTAKITRDICNIALGKGTRNEGLVWDSWFHCASASFQTKKKQNNNYHSFCTEVVPRPTGWWRLGAEKLDSTSSYINPALAWLSPGSPLLGAAPTATRFTQGNIGKKIFYATHIFYCLVVGITCFLTALSEDYLITVKTNFF